jgi:anti-sigma regulatory factor (Ser/Thr protein kinase)
VSLERDFPAVASSLAPIRRAVATFAEQAGVSSRLGECAVQAVHEAAVNAIVHAYGGGDGEGAVHLEATADDSWLRLTVSDTGPGFRPSRASPGYGLGLAIIAQLADELEIRDGEHGGLTVVIAFRVRT